MDEPREPSSPAAGFSNQEKESAIQREVDSGKGYLRITVDIRVPTWMTSMAAGVAVLIVVSGAIAGGASWMRLHLAPPPAAPAAITVATIEPARESPTIADADFSFCTMGGGSSGCCSRVGFMQGTWPGHDQPFKGSLPTVYMMGLEGKRMVFPRHYELISWFGRDRGDGIPDEYDASLCRDVLEIPDATLASIMLGGNVQLREGTLLNFRSDRNLYIVDGNYITFSTIRRLKYEEVALELFGPEGYKKITYVEDAFRANYVQGTDVEGPDEYLKNLVTNLTRH